MKERELIEQIRRLTGSGSPELLQGIGDDCAVVAKDSRTVWLLTMDTLLESVHFDCSWHPPLLLGRKTVSVNVSDIAAMGGRPVFVLLSLGLPPDFDEQWSQEFCRGIDMACREYGCLLIGGDTVRSPGGVSLTLTVIGEMERDRVLYRHAARPGDTVWVSGPLGQAAAGLELFRAGAAKADLSLQPLLEAHLDPRARVDLAPLLAESGLVHAMMDLSDGLATDLSHLCEQSGVGAEIREESLPGRESLTAAAQLLQQEQTSWMIAGGEDYELLFTTDPVEGRRLQATAAEQGLRIHAVGRIVQGRGVSLVQGKEPEGEVRDITYLGYDHFRLA